MRYRKNAFDLVLAFLKKWLFPDFTNKLTWLVATVGLGILVTPDPIVLIVSNWLVSTFSLNSGVPYALPDLVNGSTHSLYGIALVFFALAHNLISQYLQSVSLSRGATINKQRDNADIELFNKFISEFGSHSEPVYSLKEQDFGSSFLIEGFKEIGGILHNWNIPERTFLNKNIETKKMELLQECAEFYRYLAANSYSQNSVDVYSVIPDDYKRKSSLPTFVKERINMLNGMADDCYELHREFVVLCKKELNC